MSTLADHYADALADVAMAQNAAAQIRGELADFAQLLRDSPELNVLLGSPAVSRENKQGVLEAVVKDLGASHTFRNFLSVVLDRRRMALLPEIQLAFDAQLDKRQGLTRAEVTSAHELSDAEKAQLRGVLEKISGSRVEAEYKLDTALIGGTVVRIGSTIYDGSVRMQLDRLRTQIASQ